MQKRVVEYLQQMQSRELIEGQELFQEGAPPDDTMYFLLAGEVGIFKKRPEGERRINSLSARAFFGEMALVNNRPRLATARVISSRARVAVMNKDILLKLAGSSPQLLFNLLKYSVTRLLAGEDKLQRVKEELRSEKKARGLA